MKQIYLGQEVKTPDGVGKVIGLGMDEKEREFIAEVKFTKPTSLPNLPGS